jgi:hypothetical protein
MVSTRPHLSSQLLLLLSAMDCQHVEVMGPCNCPLGPADDPIASQGAKVCMALCLLHEDISLGRHSLQLLGAPSMLSCQHDS